MNQNRTVGLQIVAAMKANVYGCTIEEAMEHHVRDVIDLTGEWTGYDPAEPVIVSERRRLYEQADFVGQCAIDAVKKLGI